MLASPSNGKQFYKKSICDILYVLLCHSSAGNQVILEKLKLSVHFLTFIYKLNLPKISFFGANQPSHFDDTQTFRRKWCTIGPQKREYTTTSLKENPSFLGATPRFSRFNLVRPPFLFTATKKNSWPPCGLIVIPIVSSRCYGNQG